MTRPTIIRADSIDLQDRDAPSAKDHSHSHLISTKQTTTNHLSPHQAETLREVAAETAEENLRSPRASWTNGDIGDLQQYAEDLSAGVTNALNIQTDSQNGAKSNAQGGTGHDALAIAQNGGHPGQDVSDDGDMDADGDEGMDDDMMDKISSSPSIEDEDIDFEFVYALHTFVATVEGQANATKGDTMVLLDDTNSYWWLVRVVKDSSIGYLPAEHIETPTERLARLNKHRNIDLSATMLGDQAEKSKNPLRSAMKRRKTKTVTFSQPTYIDPSDVEYSTEEEDMEADVFAQQQQQQQQQAQEQQSQQQQQQQQQQQTQQATARKQASEQATEDETAKVEPLKPRAQPRDGATESKKVETVDDADAAKAKNGSRLSEEIFETKSDGPKKLSDGTVRDSFFKDDTVETKKITLTPNLLRDDNTSRTSSDASSLKQRPSLERIDKDGLLAKDDKRKKDKKDKDKKPSGIRGFFSRKDKRKTADEDDDSFGKRSMEMGADGLEREEDEPQPSPERQGEQNGVVVRNPSKLQKHQPRTEPSPTRRSSTAAKQQKEPGMDLATFLAEGRTTNGPNAAAATMRVVGPESRDLADRDDDLASTGAVKALNGGPKTAPLTSQNDDVRPQKVTKAKSRVELDDFDSIDEDIAPAPVRQAPVPDERQRQERQERQEAPEPTAARQAAQAAAPQRPSIPGAFPDSYLSSRTTSSDQTERPASPNATTTPPQRRGDRLSESPVQVSPDSSSNLPQLVGDTSSQEEDHSSPRSSSELGQAEEDSTLPGDKPDESATTSPSTNHTAPPATWNDASLRAFFDSGSDIRDLLVVVYDKTDVAPVGPDHPVAGSLFREQNTKLAEITTQLDNMLGDWLARKQRVRGTF